MHLFIIGRLLIKINQTFNGNCKALKKRQLVVIDLNLIETRNKKSRVKLSLLFL